MRRNWRGRKKNKNKTLKFSCLLRDTICGQTKIFSSTLKAFEKIKLPVLQVCVGAKNHSRKVPDLDTRKTSPEIMVVVN